MPLAVRSFFQEILVTRTLSALARNAESPVWSLFGPYVPGRWGPQGNGLQRKISNLGLSGTQPDARNQLEVPLNDDSAGFTHVAGSE